LKLFVGLGNPGGQYARHRHNVGFMAVDAIAAAHGFAPWRAKFHGEVAEGRLGPEKVLLLKPGTFMNLSGDAVRAALQFYKLEPGDVTVFHDELDLVPGRIRVKTGGGHAGHNGLRSIDAHIGPAFHRVRIGIGHPGDKRLVSPYVLGDFAKADADWLDDLLRGIADGAPELAAGDTVRFLHRVGLAARPEPAAKPKPPGPERPVPPAPELGSEPGPEPQRSSLQRLVDRFR
jgi:peptidyl-tRNA hydrolase, PTH1 family